MQTIITYFETIPPLHRSLILVGGLSLFWLLENNFPLQQFRYIKWKHALPNLFFTSTTVVINFLLAFLLLHLADWVVNEKFGLLYLIEGIPFWLHAILGLLLLDLVGAFLPHWLEHQVKPLWMIHLVHHSDHKVDTTTANRHHPLESFVRFVFTLIGVFVIGTSIGIVMLYQTSSLIATQFNHANLKLPKKVDLFLSYFIVSPDMHKIHHHYVLPFTDSNYGNIFSFWDRLFGTYKYLDREKVVYGVDVSYDEKTNSKISSLLIQPFQKYKNPATGK